MSLAAEGGAPLSFDAALDALDYQPVDVRDNGTHVYELLGIDDVRAAHAEAVRVAVEAEREACAKVCAIVSARSRGDESETGYAFRGASEQCAAAIRARKEAKS